MIPRLRRTFSSCSCTLLHVLLSEYNARYVERPHPRCMSNFFSVQRDVLTKLHKSWKSCSKFSQSLDLFGCLFHMRRTEKWMIGWQRIGCLNCPSTKVWVRVIICCGESVRSSFSRDCRQYNCDNDSMYAATGSNIVQLAEKTVEALCNYPGNRLENTEQTY